MGADALNKALAVVGALALVFALGTYTGHRVATNAGAAQALKVAQAHAKALDAARVQGAAQVAVLNADLARRQTNQITLEERLRHAPLTVALAPKRCASSQAPAPVPVHAAQGASAPAAPGQHGADPAMAQPPPLPELAAGDGGDAGPGLTLAAVSLWNSALAGADVLAGACWPAGATEPACAVAAGTSIQQAWANQATNAASCAADRARYLSLIDHLRRTRQN